MPAIQVVQSDPDGVINKLPSSRFTQSMPMRTKHSPDMVPIDFKLSAFESKKKYNELRQQDTAAFTEIMT